MAAGRVAIKLLGTLYMSVKAGQVAGLTIWHFSFKKMCCFETKILYNYIEILGKTLYSVHIDSNCSKNPFGWVIKTH